MKYFVHAEERAASGHENYLEFQISGATEEFWDKTSLYMAEDVLKETGFAVFWTKCVCDDIVFDCDTISEEELQEMAGEAAKQGGTVLEVISELKTWVEMQRAGSRSLSIVWPQDRI